MKSDENVWAGSSDGLLMNPSLTTGDITEVNPNGPAETEITTFNIDGNPAPNPYVYATFDLGGGGSPSIYVVADKSQLEAASPYTNWTYIAWANTLFPGQIPFTIPLSPSIGADRVARNIADLMYGGANAMPATFDGSLTVDMLDNHCCVDENGICRSGIMDVDGSCLIAPL